MTDCIPTPPSPLCIPLLLPASMCSGVFFHIGKMLNAVGWISTPGWGAGLHVSLHFIKIEVGAGGWGGQDGGLVVEKCALQQPCLAPCSSTDSALWLLRWSSFSETDSQISRWPLFSSDCRGKKAFWSATASIHLCLCLSFLCAKCHLGYLIEHKTYHWEMKCSVACGEIQETKEHI